VRSRRGWDRDERSFSEIVFFDVAAAERGALSFFARAWDAFLARGREDTTRDAIRTR
jgi:hypothetical protein